eukprot:scaffold224697_cov45-Prasinocladus_malaysianus.AAC.1
MIDPDGKDGHPLPVKLQYDLCLLWAYFNDTTASEDRGHSAETMIHSAMRTHGSSLYGTIIHRLQEISDFTADGWSLPVRFERLHELIFHFANIDKGQLSFLLSHDGPLDKFPSSYDAACVRLASEDDIAQIFAHFLKDRDALTGRDQLNDIGFQLMQYSQGRKVHIFTCYNHLATRDQSKFRPFFEALNIKSQAINSTSQKLDASVQVVYGDLHTFLCARQSHALSRCSAP